MTGELESIYYQPFKKTIPLLIVSLHSKIAEPDDPYVYRQYLKINHGKVRILYYSYLSF
ncbi:MULTISPECIES: TIGR03943 family putative permease subunit [Peribacillus]|uniref:TIGR03943 family putative permease subunit n=1 Tax=Peribacillus TaxID=2675229 RepID=UPI003014FF04